MTCKQCQTPFLGTKEGVELNGYTGDPTASKSHSSTSLSEKGQAGTGEDRAAGGTSTCTFQGAWGQWSEEMNTDSSTAWSPVSWEAIALSRGRGVWAVGSREHAAEGWWKV